MPLVIQADQECLQQMEALLSGIDTDQAVTMLPVQDGLRVADIQRDNHGDLIVIPGFGSRKRVLATLGNFPERLAASFNGNLLILHFDK